MRLLIKYEPVIFYGMVLIYATPVLFLHFFPTVDGPAHLYNSNLLNSYFSSASSTAHNYFQFNAEPEPNWLGHLLLCILNLFLPSFIAEKIVLLLYVFLLPVTFRLLVNRLKPDNIIAVYFIFPFIYSFLFYLGFFNFCLSIGLLFGVLYYWLNHREFYTLKNGVLFSVLLLLLYFAHLFSFLLFLFIVGTHFIFNYFKTGKTQRNISFKKLCLQLLPYLPGILLTINFVLKKGASGDVSYLPVSNLIKWIVEFAPATTLNYEKEYMYAKAIAIVWFFVFVSIIIVRVKNKTLFFSNDLFLFCACCMLLLYFIFPDSAATGGYISMRLLLFFYLLFVLWMAIQNTNRIILIAAATACIVFSFVLLIIHYNDSKLLSADASEIYTASDYIPEGKNVLPLNYSGNWLHANFSNYIGSEKNIIVLDNYEAAKPHFPLRWKKNVCPYDVAGDFANSYTPCLTIDKYEKKSGIKIDYITRWYYNKGMNDSCTQRVNQLLENSFEKIYTSPDNKLELFKRR